MPQKRFNLDGMSEEKLRALTRTIERRIARNARDARRVMRGPRAERVAICGRMTMAAVNTPWRANYDRSRPTIWTEQLWQLTGFKLSWSQCQKLRNGNQRSLTWEQLNQFAKAVGRQPQDFILFT